MKVAIYPGSFDPITLGHMDIIDRGCGLFDKIVVAVAQSEGKRPLFSLDERVRLVKEIYKDNERVEVLGFPRQLTVDLAREHNACAIIRGLRAVADFEYEFQLATMNRALAPDIESIFLTPKESLIYVSSSLIKEISDLKGDVSKFVHPIVEQALQAKLDRS
ncbi:MAG: pantetheine-phosphate adenylyltransferase [Gammaproteobacteria bacterium]|uniref:Phosphopantetheine adenylyltransferase n=1 Tax=SAR86 cluster bacterium TaxID=2030880 RepID=A0A838YY22_9GAMM|nr:pantetheine-phosphate adenylyltransferase [SAR86 cluster bacterium]